MYRNSLAQGAHLLPVPEGEFDTAMKAALAETQHFVLIEAELDKLDISPALMQLAEQVSKKV